jgi:hypothetical protein
MLLQQLVNRFIDRFINVDDVSGVLSVPVAIKREHILAGILLSVVIIVWLNDTHRAVTVQPV